MKRLSLMTFAAALVLAGCSDGVPKVVDPHNIVVDGKPMTQQQFLDTYCKGKKDSETCLIVAKAMTEDSTKSKNGPPRF